MAIIIGIVILLEEDVSVYRRIDRILSSKYETIDSNLKLTNSRMCHLLAVKVSSEHTLQLRFLEFSEGSRLTTTRPHTTPALLYMAQEAPMMVNTPRFSFYFMSLLLIYMKGRKSFILLFSSS